MTPSTIVLATTIFIIIWFLIQGLLYTYEGYNTSSYFLYGKSLTSGEYNRSFAAGSTSLATVLFFFVTFGVRHGVYVLLAPLAYLIGGYIYNEKMLPRMEEQGFFGNEEASQREVSIGSTLAKYIYERYRSVNVRVSVIIVTIIGILSILLIELYVGVRIFSVFLSEGYRDVGLIVIAVVVFAYTTLGGLPAVVETDRIQINLMYLATIVMVGALSWEVYNLGHEMKVTYIFPDPPKIKKGLLLPYPLLMNIIVVNSLMIPSLLRTWQLTSSSSSPKEVKKGLYQGIGITVMLTFGFVMIGILLFNSIDPSVEFSLLGILDYIAGGLFTYTMLPLFFGACLAALLSTADSALMPILQSLYQDILEDKVNENEGGSFMITVVITSILILTFAVGLYYIVFRILEFNLINWLFTIFSLVIVVSPPVIYAVIMGGERVQSTASVSCALIAIWGGLGIAIAVSVIGNYQSMPWLVQLNSPLAATFGGTCFVVKDFIWR